MQETQSIAYTAQVLNEQIYPIRLIKLLPEQATN